LHSVLTIQIKTYCSTSQTFRSSCMMKMMMSMKLKCN
jgi:hypothetical protein